MVVVVPHPDRRDAPFSGEFFRGGGGVGGASSKILVAPAKTPGPSAPT